MKRSFFSLQETFVVFTAMAAPCGGWHAIISVETGSKFSAKKPPRSMNYAVPYFSLIVSFARIRSLLSARHVRTERLLLALL
jgi:hypothetical protein